MFHAIISDFDLEDGTFVTSARETLDAIKANAEIEESSTLNHCENSNAANSGSANESPYLAHSENGNASSKGETNITSLTQSLASADLSDHAPAVEENGDIEYDAGIESLTEGEKILLLRDVVPSVKEFDVSFALKKNHGTFKKTLDDLLSLAYLQGDHGLDGETLSVPKGIDGFAEPATKKKRKGKKKTKGAEGQQSNDFPASLNEHPGNAPKGEDVTKKDIFFLMSRTNLSWDYVSHRYHGAGGSLKRTVEALCKSDQVAMKHRAINDPDLEGKYLELGFAYWNIDPSDRQALVILTHPQIGAAYELAEILVNPNIESYSEYKAKKEVMPQYRQPARSTPTPFTDAIKRPPQRPFTPVKPAVAPKAAAAPSRSFAPASAPDFAAKRTTAFAQAAAAYRKSRSNPLMAAAAAHYAAVGREATARAQGQTSTAAQTWVAGRATATSVDLHGVTVRDAVGIATERVQRWWETSGEAEWAREGRAWGEATYRVVVGAGHHSDGGRAKLGPAVKRALEERRWRVSEDGPGVLVVKGRMRAG